MSSLSSTPTRTRSRGRPREFELDTVLDQAVRVFSERGYHGTSISDLAHATGLAQGSLYKAFKDKQAIFLAAFERYRAQRSEKLRQAIGDQGTGLSTCPAPVARHIRSALERNEALLAELIRQGQEDGSIAQQVDCEAAARTLLCLIQGMRLVGKAGRTRPVMHAVVETALAMLD